MSRDMVYKALVWCVVEQVCVVYKELHNKWLDRLLLKIRTCASKGCCTYMPLTHSFQKLSQVSPFNITRVHTQCVLFCRSLAFV